MFNFFCLIFSRKGDFSFKPLRKQSDINDEYDNNESDNNDSSKVATAIRNALNNDSITPSKFAADENSAISMLKKTLSKLGLPEYGFYYHYFNLFI